MYRVAMEVSFPSRNLSVQYLVSSNAEPVLLCYDYVAIVVLEVTLN